MPKPEKNCKDDQGNHKLQEAAQRFTIQNHSILDALTKFQEACAKTNRSISKAVTKCGCVKIKAEKQHIPPTAKFSEASSYLSTHLEGCLCEKCKDVVEQEVGQTVFYLAALCSDLCIDFNDVVQKEVDRVSALGVFSLA